MPELPRLTDAAVRQLAGPRLYERAAASLGFGKIVERTAYADGVITGKWDTHPGAPLAAVMPAATGVLLDCTCDDIQVQAACEHATALALAWARSPHTFARVDRPSGVDELLDGYQELMDSEDDDNDAGFDDEVPLDSFESARPGHPSPAPVVERATSTLTLQLPGLQAEYRARLANLTVPQLRELAQRRGVKLAGAKREPMIETLAEALGRPPAIRAAWGALSAPARLALGLTPFLNTELGVHPQQLRQTLQAVNSKAADQLNAAVDELKSAGLMFDNNGYLLVPSGLPYLLPADPSLARPLSEVRGLREARAPGPLEFPTFMLRLLLAIKADAAHLQLRPRELHPLQTQVPEISAWPFVPAELAALSRDRNLYNTLYTHTFTVPPAPPLLTEAAAQTLRGALEAPADLIEFGLRLLAKMGIVALAAGQPPGVREEGFAQYLSHHPVEHLAPLFNAWMNLRDWTELDWLCARQTNLRLRRQGSSGMTYAQLVATLSSARQFLVHQLRRAPAEEWIDLDGLVARARALNLLQATWPMPPGFSLEWNGRALNLTNADDWRLFYGPFVQIVLTGPLLWMGLVDLGYRKENLAAFRLTDLGAFLLYQRDTYTAPPVTLPGRALTYAGDGTLLLQPAAAEPRLLGLLSLLGEVRTGPKGALVYRVTAAGAARAFEAGGDPDTISALLASGAGAPPPAALASRLRQWWEHFGDAHLYRDLALMELADDYALTELLASTSLSQYLLYRFSSRLIALRPEGVEALCEQLVGKGYTPKIVEG